MAICGNGHLRAGICSEAVHRQLFHRELNIRHDNVHVHGESWIAMFLHCEAAADIMGDVEEI
jgi:hypothetical protein